MAMAIAIIIMMIGSGCKGLDDRRVFHALFLPLSLCHSFSIFISYMEVERENYVINPFYKIKLLLKCIMYCISENKILF